MDPLSITTSAVTLIQVAGAVSGPHMCIRTDSEPLIVLTT